MSMTAPSTRTLTEHLLGATQIAGLQTPGGHTEPTTLEIDVSSVATMFAACSAELSRQMTTAFGFDVTVEVDAILAPEDDGTAAAVLSGSINIGALDVFVEAELNDDGTITAQQLNTVATTALYSDLFPDMPAKAILHPKALHSIYVPATAGGVRQLFATLDSDMRAVVDHCADLAATDRATTDRRRTHGWREFLLGT